MTLIIVSYRHGQYLPALFDSIEAQTVRPAEIIACDDASPDGSGAVLRSLVDHSEIPTTVVINPTNRGLTPTLNNALAMVKTPYFAYISGDDTMRPHRIERQVASLELRPDLAFVYSDAGRIDGAGNQLPGGFVDQYTQGLSPAVEDSFSRLLTVNWIPAPSVMVRTEAVRAVGGYDETLFFEDHDLWLRLARRYEFSGTVERLVDFRELDTSLGHTKFRDDDMDWQWAKVAVRSKHFGVSPELDRVISRLMKPWLITLGADGRYLDRLAPVFSDVARADPTVINRAYAFLSRFSPRALRSICRSRRSYDTSDLASRRSASPRATDPS